MAKRKTTDVTITLDDLLRSRYEGASNIAGIRFQLLYSVLRMFDLYADNPATQVQFEGIEDVDIRGTKEQMLKGLQIRDTYVQVKLTGVQKTLSWLDYEKVLDHFIEVYLKQPDVRFVLVTSLPPKSNLEDLARYCHSELATLPPSVDQKLKTIAIRSHLKTADLPTFLRRVSFEHIDEDELVDRLRVAAIQSFHLNAGNEILYLSHFIDCAIMWAANRAVLQKQHMEAEKVRVQEWISLGVKNPAVRDRLIQPLKLVEKEMGEGYEEDYYEGKQTRPSHILAALDAPRPIWQRTIEMVLQRVRICIIRASSGQGKSTLLYRYAIDHFAPDTIYRLHVCTREEQIGPLVDYLRNRLLLGLPLLVLVDNLSYQTRLWHQVAAELADSPVCFLVTSREEDWYRYGLGASSAARDFVEPHLSLPEARVIYHDFSQRGKVAATVPSAGWAYEQVADRRLLLEFVYLITHGRMLAERIEEQISTIEDQKEDQAKIEVLRLVATAQLYNSRVRITSLLQHVNFQRDPDYALKTLEREYMTCMNGECEGLHFVRSEHLVRALHVTIPVEYSVCRLLKILDATNLIPLISSAFSDARLKANELLPALVERTQEASLSLVNAIIETLFLTDEMAYFQVHKPIFDTAVEQLGTYSLMLLTALTLPSGEVKSLRSLAEQNPDRPALQVLSRLAQQFHPRDKTGSQHIPRDFLEAFLKTLHLDDQAPLADIGQLCSWCHFFHVSAPALNEFLLSTRWETGLFQYDGESIAQFLQALYQCLSDRHHQFIITHQSTLFRRFKLESRTLRIEEKDNDIEIVFIVDESDEADSPNDQAVWRLQLLQRWFPHYEHYCSQGLYPSNGGQKPKVDDSYKNMTGETLELTTTHAPKNKLYRQLVEESYASLLVYDWAKQWRTFRQKALQFIRSIISHYEKAYRRGSINMSSYIHTQAQELVTLQEQILSLPNRLKDTFASQEQDLNQWRSFLRNFLQQFPRHDPHNPQQQDSHLMRRNLKDVIKRLPTLHQAFAALFEIEADHFNMTALNNQENETYSYLADLLDFWFENDIPHVGNLRAAIKKWREKQRHTFVHTVTVCLAPLAECGMKFLYPISPAHDHPLVGLYLGYEVMDFTQQIEQVAQIVSALASLQFEYHFLYLIPIVHKQQVGTTAMRFTQQTVKQLAADNSIAEEIYPVPLPKDIHTILPDLDTTPLTDIALVLDLGTLQASLIVEQNKLSLACSMLDMQVAEEGQLFRYYEEVVGMQLQQLLASWTQLQEKAHLEGIREGQQEWQCLWEQAVIKMKQLANFDDISISNMQQIIKELSFLDMWLAKYMNRKYLGL